MISRLCGERDELRRTEERLHLEHSMAREEHDQAIRERGEAHREAMALQTDLGDMVARRLEAEEVSARLGMKLAEVRGILQAESDEHDLLCAAVGAAFDDLGVARPKGTSSLAAHANDITMRVRQLEENDFHARITQAFAIARSHYDQSIDLETMNLGFASGYEASELDEIEKAVTPIAWNLVDKMKDIVLPPRK